MTLAERPLIVVPTYNEVDNIDELLAGIGEHAPFADVLFVDDGSRDGTVDRIRNHQSRREDKIHLLQRPSKMGLGTAYVDGFKWALKRSYDVVQEMDADLSHPPEKIPDLYAPVRGGQAADSWRRRPPARPDGCSPAARHRRALRYPYPWARS